MTIVAEVRSDDYAYRVRFDAEPWFRQAGDHRILSLASAGWGNNYMADAVVEYFDGKEDYEGVTKLFEYVSAHPTMGRLDTLGFECSCIDQGAALRWIEANRPHLFPTRIAAAMNEAEGHVITRAYGSDRC